MSIPCQNCGQMNDPKNEFCGMCGNAIDKSVSYKAEVIDEPIKEQESKPKKKFVWTKRNKILVTTFAVLSIIPLSFLCRTIVIQTTYNGSVGIRGEQQSDYQVVFTLTAESGKIKIELIRITYEDYSYTNRPIDLVLLEYGTHLIQFNLPLTFEPFNGQISILVELFGGGSTLQTINVYSNYLASSAFLLFSH